MIGSNAGGKIDAINATTNKCNDIVGYITSMSGNILPYDVRYISGGIGDIDIAPYTKYLSDNLDVQNALHVDSSPKKPIY